MALDEPKDNEQPVHVDGIDVLVEDFARTLVDDMTIDYVQHPDGKGFVINSGDVC